MSENETKDTKPHPSEDPAFAIDIPPILEPYHGERPPAPAWFERALERRPERTTVDVDGAAIELLTWGERGKPGLLFLHGNGAHADWWSFIAPFFADDFRCAAMSWSGMGRSDWRERYSIEGFGDEALAAAEAAGLFEAREKPIFIAHSFGGTVTNALAAAHGERLRAAIIVDSGARPPERQWRGPPRRSQPNRVYPTLESALARFRLMPPQDCQNHYIVDYIAREALRPAPLDDGSGQNDSGQNGWSWRFDPFIWSKMDFREAMDTAANLAAAKCRLAFVWGAESKLMQAETVEYSRSHAAFGSPFFAVPEAEHHVLLDQPLALVAALRGVIAGWP